MTDNSTRTLHPTKRPESVLVLIHTVDLDVLLIKRVRPSDFWQSVTGSLEWPDETPTQAAVREVMEETGITIDAASHDSGGTHILRDWQHTECFEIPPAWSARYGSGVTMNTEHLFSLQIPARCDIVIDPSEHTEWRWTGIDEAIDTVWSWTNRNGLERLRAIVRDKSP